MQRSSLIPKAHIGDSHGAREANLLYICTGLMLLWALLNGVLGVIVGHLIDSLESGWPVLLCWGAFAVALPVFTGFIMFRFLPKRSNESTRAEHISSSVVDGIESVEAVSTREQSSSPELETPEDSVSASSESTDESTSDLDAPKKGRFHARCEEISSRYLLSRRESEVFLLLAKGHNAAFIQEKLCVSRSTAKTHINHIYRKLDIHTQQELLNMVEDRRRSRATEEFHVYGSSPAAVKIDDPRVAMEQAIKGAAQKRPANYRTDIFAK